MTSESKLPNRLVPNLSSQALDRRNFCRLATLTAASALAGGRAYAGMGAEDDAALSTVHATLAIEQKQVTNSVTLDSSFASLSVEKGEINLSPAYLTSSNTDLAGLLNALGGGVLRVGGNTTDERTWTPGGSGETAGQVAPSDVRNFASLIKACPRWKAIYGINFRGKDGSSASPELAADEAVYATEQIGSQLLGFEIGNEPELYGEGITFDVFLNGGTTSGGEKIAGWTEFAAAIRAAVPHAVFTGPAAASDRAGWTEDFAASEKGKIALLTEHYYISNYSSAQPSIPGMLTYPSAGIVAALKNVQSAAAKVGKVPFRFDECNSYFGSTHPAGVANAFAAALWAIDYIFTHARYGSSGVNFHNSGDVTGYAAIAETNSVVDAVQPLYYGLFLFSNIFRGGAKGVLLESTLTVSGAALTAFVVSSEGSTYVVLNNKDTANAASVKITGFASSATKASVMTLASSGGTPPEQLGNLGIYNGGSPITFGGQAVALDGRWHGTSTETPVSKVSVTVYVAAASAALVQIQ